MRTHQRNFYQKLDKKYTGGQITYETQKIVNIDVPFRMLIIGSSGSGKTNTLMNVIDHMNCFNRFYIFCRNLDQPLYNFFIDKLKQVARKVQIHESDLFIASNTIDDLPVIDTFDKTANNLVIIDDFVGDSPKNLKKISNFFIRSRTFNTSVVFISQSYFSVPKLIRINADYIIFKRTNDINDLMLIIKSYFKGNENKIIQIYNKLMLKKDNDDFMLFDLKTSNPKLRVRINWDQGLSI
jgi:Cdc6-like AAA superfamily ATPase